VATLKYKLRIGGKDFFVSLDVEELQQSAPIIYEGASLGCDYIRSILRNQTGAFGHLISNATNPIDLYAAMMSADMQRFNPELVEGSELVENYDSQIPDGAMS
jgi:hypothetical protein